MRVAIYLLCLLAAVIYAGVRGGGPERATAAALVAIMVVDTIAHFLAPPTWIDVDAIHFTIDASALCCFFAIAMRANRFWPLCVTSLQAIAVIGHLAKAIDLAIHPTAYGIMQVATSYPLIAVLIIGTWAHARRERLTGSEQSWRSSSLKSHPTGLMP